MRFDDHGLATSRFADREMPFHDQQTVLSCMDDQQMRFCFIAALPGRAPSLPLAGKTAGEARREGGVSIAGPLPPPGPLRGPPSPPGGGRVTYLTNLAEIP